MNADQISDSMAAIKAKIEGIDRISNTAESKNGWMSTFFTALQKVCRENVGQCWIGEEVRRAVLAAGLSHPVHPNAWGAAITMGVRRGLLVETGNYRKMTTKASHARKTPEYRVTEESQWKEPK